MFGQQGGVLIGSINSLSAAPWKDSHRPRGVVSLIRRSSGTHAFPCMPHPGANFVSGSGFSPGKRLPALLASWLHRTDYAAWHEGKHAEKGRESEEIFDRRQ
jgi:hypothetical protein